MLDLLLSRVKKHLFDQDGSQIRITGKAVQEAIALAEANRHKMFVSLTKNDQDPSFVGYCMQHNSQQMLIDIGNVGDITGLINITGTGGLQHPDELAGGEVEVHFAAQEHGSAFYKFTTRIHSIQSKRGHTTLLLDLPKDLVCAQRRGFFRLAPPMQSVRVLCVLRADDTSFLPSNIGKESFLCDKAIPTWSLVNISATGMRIAKTDTRIAKRPKKNTAAATFQTDDRLICYLELIPPDDPGLLRLWILCEIAYIHAEENRITLGLGYKAWTEPVPDTQPNTWRKLDKIDYIDPLHRWILKQQFKKNVLAFR